MVLSQGRLDVAGAVAVVAAVAVAGILTVEQAGEMGQRLVVGNDSPLGPRKISTAVVAVLAFGKTEGDDDAVVMTTMTILLSKVVVVVVVVVVGTAAVADRKPMYHCR